jgi:hypothetical protein
MVVLMDHDVLIILIAADHIEGASTDIQYLNNP